MRVDRQLERAAADLLLEQRLVERDRSPLHRTLLRRDHAQRALRIVLEEGAVRLRGGDVPHPARHHVDDAGGAATPRLGEGAAERRLGERADDLAGDLLGVSGPSIRGRARDAELVGERLHADTLAHHEPGPRERVQVVADGQGGARRSRFLQPGGPR